MFLLWMKLAFAEECPMPTTLDKIDSSFGEFFVKPLGSILFCDLYYWDNHLPLGEGINEIIDGDYILSYENEIYTKSKQYDRVVNDYIDHQLQQEIEKHEISWTYDD